MSTNSLEKLNDNNIKSKNEKKSKRSMSWSQLLLPSYKTRLLEFRKIFAKTVPSTERLIADFSCALQKEILIQGRLYLSVNYLTFHANIFGWETVVTIRLCDITALTKANTIRVIPNAIQVITTNGNKYIFTSFVARDKAFKRLYRLWQDIVIGQKMTAAELWQLIHYNYGSYLGVSSDSEEEDEEELNVITRNNINIVEEELDEEVFNDNNIPIKPRHDSISSFLTCPESELEEELNQIETEVLINDSRDQNCWKLAKIVKYWRKTSSRESLLLKLLLVLSVLLLLMHFLILYKLSNVNLSQPKIDLTINDLKQLVDLTTRLVKDTDYSDFK